MLAQFSALCCLVVVALGDPCAPLCPEVINGCNAATQKPSTGFFQNGNFPEPSLQSNYSAPCRNFSKISETMLSPNPQDVPLDDIYIVNSVHNDIGFTDTAHCVLARYYCVILPCHAYHYEHAAPSEKIPLTVTAFVVYMGIHCKKLEAWFPGLYAGFCSNIDLPGKMEQWIRRGAIDWTRGAFYGIFDWETSLPYFLRPSELLDTLFPRYKHRSLMVQDSGISQNFIDMALDNGIENIFVGMNPTSYIPDDSALSAGMHWQHSDGTRAANVLFHPLSYGHVVCSPFTTSNQYVACDTKIKNFGPGELDILGVSVMKRGNRRVGLVTVIMNENTGGIYQALEAANFTGGAAGFRIYLTDILLARWSNRNTRFHFGSLDDFFNGSELVERALRKPHDWIQGQQWLPQESSDPIIPRLFSAINDVIDANRALVLREYVPEAIGSQIFVEHNYGVTTNNYAAYHLAANEKLNWKNIWNATTLKDQVKAAIDSTVSPPLPPDPQHTECGDTVFNMRGPVIDSISLCDGARIWEASAISDPQGSVPVFQIGYTHTPSSVVSGYAPGHQDICQFIIKYRFDILDGDSADAKHVQAAVIFTYPEVYTGQMDLEIRVEANQTGMSAIPDAMAIGFAPSFVDENGVEAEWTIYPDISLRANKCSGRAYALRRKPRTVNKGPYAISAKDSIMVFVPDRSSLSVVDGVVIANVRTLDWTNGTVFAAPPVSGSGIFFPLWNADQCCWAVETPLAATEWDNRVNWHFQLSGPPTSQTVQCGSQSNQTPPSLVGIGIGDNSSWFVSFPVYTATNDNVTRGPEAPIVISWNLRRAGCTDDPTTMFCVIPGDDNSTSKLLAVTKWELGTAVLHDIPIATLPQISLMAFTPTMSDSGVMWIAQGKDDDPTSPPRLFYFNTATNKTTSSPPLTFITEPWPTRTWSYQVLPHPMTTGLVIVIQSNYPWNTWIVDAGSGTPIAASTPSTNCTDFFHGYAMPTILLINNSIFFISKTDTDTFVFMSAPVESLGTQWSCHVVAPIIANFYSAFQLAFAPTVWLDKTRTLATSMYSSPDLNDRSFYYVTVNLVTKKVLYTTHTTHLPNPSILST